ncbi:hypothetical protein QLS71_002415 [Mariniflexile litorale]|uniref:DUF4296 domain-containing protein n=1 Tax=Mariniflexile litorale TaxID=3045158 RepID=A0AAU7EHE6_9FLAO|nr:hypothetical protein [Mariniflexile sp. KMM 9835]MDQ8210675.1 hypothetical protein [Mariniflexile sp. KMM 9835]
MKKIIISFFIVVATVSCISIPPEIIKTHSKELEIIEALKASHLAMVDSYVDQKILVFETFFFNEYGLVYRNNWVGSFKELNGRDYKEEYDFPKLYNDLVAEYEEQVLPIEKIRFDLKTSINTEYTNAMDLHKTTGNWIDNLKKINDSQRKTIDSMLNSIKPGFSLSSIDTVIENAKSKLKTKIETLD